MKAAKKKAKEILQIIASIENGKGARRTGKNA
jgi:hypothetical protein